MTINVNFELLTRISIILLILYTILPCSTQAQSAGEYSALSNLHKKKWERCQQQLQKALSKDSANAVADYVYSLFYFTADNPKFHVDSSYHYAMRAMQHMTQLGAKQRERVKRFPLDSAILNNQITKIDSAAFRYARQVNTEQAYLYFLKTYGNSPNQVSATALRNEAAYQDALRENTYASLLAFIKKYPAAAQAADARSRYETLLYEYHTKSKRLADYELFLRQYPGTWYRRAVEQAIFELTTACGEEESFISFLKKYPASSFANKARQILFHIMLETEPASLPAFMMNDSLRQVVALNHRYLVPFLKDGKFGFMDDDGKEIIKPIAPNIAEQYRCGNITDDVIALSTAIIAANGTTLYEGNVEAFDDLGFGFLLVKTNNTIKIIHKAGFSIDEQPVEDAKLLNGKFVALKNKAWGLFTLAGRRLTPNEWDDITSLGNLVVFKRNGKSNLATSRQVAALPDQQGLGKNLFDEVKLWHNNLIWARALDFEGVLDQTLHVVIPFEKQALTPCFFGAIGLTPQGSKVYNNRGAEVGIFQRVKINAPWVCVKALAAWRFFDPNANKYNGSAYDSINFAGTFAIGHRGDSATLYCNPQKKLTFYKINYTFVPGKDSIAFLTVNQGEHKTVYNTRGQKLFTTTCDKISYAGDNTFVIVKNEKKGLVNAQGKLLLPLEYDAIGSVTNHYISLLKSMKFGLFNTLHKKQIKPAYDKNIIPYNAQLAVGFKDGAYGFIPWADKATPAFEFEEIKYWNDSVALVKKKTEWLLYHINNKKPVLDQIKDYKIVASGAAESVAIIQHQNNFGVLSSKHGTVIPLTFSDIKNLGSAVKPLYFTEKHIQEASIFVVIYYNDQGKLITRQVYEQEDYEQLYCSDK